MKQFLTTILGYLSWCAHGLPRRAQCADCGKTEWDYGPRGQFFCELCGDARILAQAHETATEMIPLDEFMEEFND
jgi:hypothetical protein